MESQRNVAHIAKIKIKKNAIDINTTHTDVI